MAYRTALVSTAMLCMTACVRPQVDIEAERAAIAARGKALVAAEAALDTQGALAFWAADGILMGHGVPIVQARAELENALNGFFQAVVEFGSTTTRIVVAASGDMAWEYGINRAVVPGPKGNLLDMGKYAAVWKKIDGEWYITLVAYSSDALAPAPM